MKKSKFLKKSFALLLAVMLVVAMIPAGASAATPPTLQSLQLGTESKAAEITGTSIYAEVNSSNVFNSFRIASYVAKDGVGDLYIVGDRQVSPGNNHDLSRYVDPSNSNLAIVPLRLVDPSNANNATEYTLTIQNISVDNDVAIKTFELANEIYSTFEPGKMAWEVIMPYNTDLDARAANTANADIEAYIELNDSSASHDWNNTTNRNGDSFAATGTIGGTGKAVFNYNNKNAATLTVTGADGISNARYSITVRRANALESFTFDEVIESDIDDINSGSFAIDRDASTITAAGYPLFGENEKILYGGAVKLTIPKYATNDDDYLKNIVFDFTSELAASTTKLSLYENGAFVTDLVSGQTEVDISGLFDSTPSVITLVASYPSSSNGGKVIYRLQVIEETNSSQAVVKRARAIHATRPGMFQEAEIDGDQINITVNNSYNLENLDLEFDISHSATASLNVRSVNVNVNPPGTVPTTQYVTYTTVRAVDARQQMTLTVTAQDLSVKTYSVNVTQAPVDVNAEAKFNSVYLKNNKTGDTYEAATESGLNEVRVTFNVPASTTISDIAAMNIYYSLPTGAEAVYYSVNAANVASEVPFPRSSSKLNANQIGQWQYNSDGVLVSAPYTLLLPDPQPKEHTNTNLETQEVTWVVRTFKANGSLDKETKYVVKFKVDDFKKGLTIKSGDIDFSIARTPAEYTDKLNENHGYYTWPAVIGTQNNKSTLEVDVPKSFATNAHNAFGVDSNGDEVDPTANVNVGDITLPDGAVLFIEDPTVAPGTATSAYRYKGVFEDGWLTNALLDIYDIKSNNGSGLDFEDVDNTIRVFIVNEKGYYNAARRTPGGDDVLDIATITSAANRGDSNVFYLIFNEGAARTPAKLNSISLIDENDYEVKGTISGNEVIFNVPYSWATATGVVTAPVDNDKHLWFKYDTNPGNILMTEAGSRFGFSGGFRKVDGTQYEGTAGNDYMYIYKNGMIGSWSNDRGNDRQDTFVDVVDEAGSYLRYGLKINIKPVETGALITSFRLNSSEGDIKGTTINVVLPYMTNLESLVATFTTSPMATVTRDETGSDVISGQTALNYKNPVVLNVKSEDGLVTNKYTINVTTPMVFTDVQDSSQWYYSWVYKAAELGLVTGYPDGSFKPLNAVTRGDFAVFVARACGMTDDELKATYTENPFLDVSIDQYYAPAVAWAADNGYVNGYNDASFKPTQTITRQEVAAVWFRVLNLTEVTNPTNTFNDDGQISPWAKGMVYACAANGIMEGKENNLFAPLKALTRAETAKVTADYVENKK